MPARILVVQNARWEGPGLIALHAEAAGLKLLVVELFQKGRQASAIPFDGLERGEFSAVVSLGSPATAYLPETNKHHEELVKLFRLVRKRRTPSFSICYSMQLFSLAHGGKVVQNPLGKEVGFKELELTAEGRSDPVVGPIGNHTTLEWHGDVVEQLPEGAVRLATSPKTQNQIAVLDGIHYLFQSDGQAAIPSMVGDWMKNDGEWATRGTGVEPQSLQRQAVRQESYLRNTFLRILGNFLALALPP